MGLPRVTAKVMIVHKECLGDTMHCNCVHKAFSVAQAFLDRYFPRRELFRPLASFLLRPAPQYHHKITAFKRKHFTHFIIGLQVCARALPVSLYMKSLHGDEGCTCLFLARFQANNTLCLPPSYLIKKWKASLHQCLSKTATQHFHRMMNNDVKVNTPDTIRVSFLPGSLIRNLTCDEVLSRRYEGESVTLRSCTAIRGQA